MALRRFRDPRRIFRWEPRAIALVGLFCGALVFATLAGPHAMYFAPVAALGALLAGRVYAAARPGIPPWLTAMLLIISFLPAAPAYQRYGGWLVRSADLGQWTGIQTHRSALRIAQMLAQQGVSGHVATLFPIVVIDANRVLPEFAAGPFFFRQRGRLFRRTGRAAARGGAGHAGNPVRCLATRSDRGRVRSLSLQVEPAHGRRADRLRAPFGFCPRCR